MLRTASKIGTADQHPTLRVKEIRLSRKFARSSKMWMAATFEALKSLCVQWEVDLSASIAEQNARIDRRKISRSQRQKEMGQLRDRIKRKMVAARL